MAETIIESSFDDLKESALAEFDRTVTRTWTEFGVKPEHLDLEIQTWYYKIEWIRNKAHESIAWKGIGDTVGRYIDRKRVIILQSTEQTFKKAIRKGMDGIHLAACYLWSREIIPGPSSSLRLINQASKAETLANYLDKLGKEENADKQRNRAKILRRIAAGEDIELPKRASGAIDKVRAAFASLEKESGNRVPVRAEYIAVGLAIGIHPGTCAVQYARWRREHK